MTDPFEEAWRLEKERQERVRAELGELGKIEEEGRRTGRTVRLVGVVVAVLLFAGLSAVMLSDPGAARAWVVLLLTVAMAGVWRFFRRS